MTNNNLFLLPHLLLYSLSMRTILLVVKAKAKELVTTAAAARISTPPANSSDAWRSACAVLLEDATIMRG
jgi:hypothetical protein